jgi:signal transduction histidine kinase
MTDLLERAWYGFDEQALTARLTRVQGPLRELVAERERKSPKFAFGPPPTHFMGMALRSSSGEVLGAIKVLDRLGPGGDLDPPGFSVADERILSTLAEQAGVVLQRHLLVEEHARQAGLQKTLVSFARELQEQMQEERILFLFLTGVTIGEGLGFNRAVLFLVGDDRQVMQVRLAIGPASQEEAHRLWTELERDVVGFAAAVRRYDRRGLERGGELADRLRGLSLPSPGHHDDLPARLLAAPEVTRLDPVQPGAARLDPSLVAVLGAYPAALVPLRAGDGEVLGAVYVDNAFNGCPIEEQALEAMEIFAGSAAAAVHSVRLLALARRTGYVSAASTAHTLAARLSALGTQASAAFSHLMASASPSLPAAQAVAQLKSEAGRLTQAARQLYMLARDGESVLAPVELRPLLENWLAKLDPELPRPEVDLPLPVVLPLERLRFAEVLTELVANAGRHAPGAKVRLRCAWPPPESLPDVISAGQRDRRWFCVAVEDDGPGIKPEHRGLVFQPLWSTREEAGAGMGLAMARRWIEDMGGYLVLAETRTGARFEILLRTLEPEAT